MIEEVKRLKLEELNKQKEEYVKRDTILRHKLDELYNKLCSLKREQKNGIMVRGNFSFFERFFTRRGDYKKFKAQAKRIDKLPRLISEIEGEVAKETAKVEQELEMSGIGPRLNEIMEEIRRIEEAETLYDIGITPMQAIEFLESNEVKPVLSEEDKKLSFHPRDYSSKSALIGVHKTKYAPTANMIKSASDANVKYKKTVKINGKEYEYSYKSARNTVHMAMNDEVSSHAYGSWDDCQYAVLIPFEDISNEKIGRAAPMDTFTRGSIELSKNTWILCPKNEVDRLKTFNPKVHVLGYEGETVKGFSKPFLTQLGYCGEHVEMWNWEDDKSAKQFYNLMEKEEIKIGTHTDTYFCEDEEILTCINQAVELSKILRDNHLITTPEDIKKVIEQLDKNYQGFGHILSGLCDISEEAKNIEPQSVIGNHRQVDIFIEEMKKNGFDISSIYQDVLRRLCRVSIANCNESNKDEVFHIPAEASEEEIKTIRELRSVLASNEYVDILKKQDAFGIFISAVIGNSILHAQERNVSKRETQTEKSL